MTRVKAALAAAALFFAGAPAVGSRVAEWTIDPRAGIDASALVSQLHDRLSAAGAGPAERPLRIAVDIAVADRADGFDLLITTTDLEADLSLRSTVRSTPSTADEAVVTALVADLGYLQAARVGFPPPIYVPPDITDVIDGYRIADLIRTVDRATGRGGADPEPGAQILDLAAHDRGVSVLLTGGSVDLGPRFELTAATPASLLPTPLPPDAAAPYEIARTSWTHDLLAVDLDRARVLRRRNGESSIAVLDLLSGAHRLDAVPGGGLIALTRQGPAYVRLTEHDIEAHRVPAAARFITAMDVDRQQHLVLYDPVDRRVVIVGLDGREIDSMRPQVDPRMLPFPHAVAALSDGSILLGGSGMIWAFDRSGRPLWLQAAPRGGRETLPAQFALEPAQDERAFYLLDGPRTRILRFGDYRADAPDAAPAATGHEDIARQLAALALAHAGAAQEWGDLAQAHERADLAAELYEHALGLFPDDQESRSGLERAVGIRSDAESVIFQEPFLRLGPDRLVIAAGDRRPVRIPLQVENPGVVAVADVSLLAAGVRVPFGRIEPGQRVERLVTLDLPDSLLATRESIALDVGAVISADEPGGPPRRMFVTLPLRIPAPPWEQVVAGAASPRA